MLRQSTEYWDKFLTRLMIANFNHNYKLQFHVFKNVSSVYPNTF